jgi:hypothetical protein
MQIPRRPPGFARGRLSPRKRGYRGCGKSHLRGEISLSGWKPLLILGRLRHEWNSCPSQNRLELKFFRSL